VKLLRGYGTDVLTLDAKVYGEFRELHAPEEGNRIAESREGCGKTQLSHTMSVICQVSYPMLAAESRTDLRSYRRFALFLAYRALSEPHC
jgi:hypothetical protein